MKQKAYHKFPYSNNLYMEKEDSYSTPNFTTLDYHHHHHHPDQNHQHHEGTSYLLNNLPQQQQQSHNHNHNHNHNQNQNQNQLSFADVMHFADFGPKLALNQTRISEEEDETDQSGIDPVYFLKFPVLTDIDDEERFRAISNNGKDKEILRDEDDEEEEEDGARDINSVQLQFIGGDLHHENNNNNSNNNNDVIANPSSSEPNNNNNNNNNNKNKRKRPRATKTSEEVESQRMTHIAVERNRRKQMNEHLRVLRALMPGSYVQRGDQASIIGGAIEFVRELEQLLQCLESQKRRRLLGDQNPRQVGAADSAGSIAGGSVTGAAANNSNNNCLPPFFAPAAIDAASSVGDSHMQMKYVVDDFGGCGGGVREETAESKSCLADVEVKLLGFDAMIKILSRRRPGQLIKAIAALEDLQFNILHTNITTIEQTVLYSFNVKVTSESRFSAEDIASSVQQIFSFIHANSTM